MRDYFLKTKTFHVGDIAADSDALLTPLWKAPNAIKIASVKFAADTDAAAADTNYNTLAVKNGSNAIASLANGPASGGTGLSKGVFAAVTPTAGYAEVAADATLTLAVTKTGTGAAISGLVIQVDYYDYNA